MSNSKKFGLLRTILNTLGLPPAAIEEIIRLIYNFLSGEDTEEA